jgi:hypothetical protein
MKKSIAIILSLLVSCAVMGFAGCADKKSESTVSAASATSIWTEVPISNELIKGHAVIKDFDLKEIITNADYVFSGTIVDMHEYEVEWTDDNGESWGPFPSSVLEVEVNEEYYGESPVNTPTLNVYYHGSLSRIFNNSVIIKDNSEYIFMSRAFDEEFIANKNIDDKFQQEEYADVYIPNSVYHLLPIDSNTVIMNRDYFSYNEEVMEKVKSPNAVTTDKLESDEPIKSGYYIALSLDDFNNAFPELFENPETLPNAEELKNLREANENNSVVTAQEGR